MRTVKSPIGCCRRYVARQQSSHRAPAPKCRHAAGSTPQWAVHRRRGTPPGHPYRAEDDCGSPSIRGSVIRPPCLWRSAPRRASFQTNVVLPTTGEERRSGEAPERLAHACPLYSWVHRLIPAPAQPLSVDIYPEMAPALSLPSLGAVAPALDPESMNYLLSAALAQLRFQPKKEPPLLLLQSSFSSCPSQNSRPRNIHDVDPERIHSQNRLICWLIDLHRENSSPLVRRDRFAVESPPRFCPINFISVRRVREDCVHFHLYRFAGAPL